MDLKEFVRELLTSDTPYSGFNLLLLSPSHQDGSSLLGYDAALLSNGGATKPIVSDGRDTFTGEIREDEWPKVAKGRQLLSEILAKPRSEEELIEDLFGLLRYKVDSPPTTREDFRRNIMIDAVRVAPVKAPHYVQEDTKEVDAEHTYYATRLSTVVLVRRTGEVLFIERDEWIYGEECLPKLASAKAGDDRHERRFHFKID